MRESTTPPVFKRGGSAVQVGNTLSRFFPCDNKVTITQKCVGEDVIHAKEHEPSYSSIYGVLLPPSASCHGPLPMSQPLLTDPRDIESFFPSIPRATFDNPGLSVASSTFTESLDEHAWNILEQHRLSIVTDLTVLIREKQEEWLRYVQRARNELHMIVQSANSRKTLAPKPEQAPSIENVKVANMFAKRQMDESEILRMPKSGLGASLERFGDTLPVSASTSKSAASSKQSLPAITLSENIDTANGSPLSPEATKQVHENEDEEDDALNSGRDDPMFQIDEDMKTLQPARANTRLNVDIGSLQVQERQQPREKASELLNSGFARSFSEISNTHRMQPKDKMSEFHDPHSIVNLYESQPFGRPHAVRRQRTGSFKPMSDHDEEIALAGAAVANAPSHRDTRPAHAFKDVKSDPSMAEADALAISMPYHPLIPVRRHRWHEMAEGVATEFKTSLPYNEKRVVPSLLQALREKNAPSPKAPANRETGFQVPSKPRIPSSIQTAKPRTVSSQALSGELPDLPQAPSRHLRLKPSVDTAPHALSSVPDRPGAEDATLSKLLYFMHYLQNLKLSKRTGWYHHRVPEPESIADHMYRMAVMAILLKENEVDVRKCVMMALVHDLAEALVGDLTPHCKVDKEEKTRREHEAIHFLTHDLLGDTDASHTIFQLWHEYEERSSLESKLVKDLDCFELCLQAFEYEKAHKIEDLQQFWNGAAPKIQHPQVQAWLAALLRKRRALWESRGVVYDVEPTAVAAS